MNPIGKGRSRFRVGILPGLALAALLAASLPGARTLAAGVGEEAAPAAATGLSPAASRGKQIFVSGRSPSGGIISARVGREATQVPASAVPCAGCHGADGLGRPEGGVLPSIITWSHLTKAYGHVHQASGRRHPAFTEASLAAAIVAGEDPAGNRLDSAMPRFQMSPADLADLIAYIKQLESDRDPGIGKTRIRLGTLLPLQGRLASLGGTMRDLMQAYFEDLDARGGIYGRQVELVVADSSGAAGGVTARLLEETPVLALVGPVTVGREREVATLTEDGGIPLVGPFTLFPQDSYALNRYTFYLFGGVREQARALVEFAADRLHLKNPHLAAIHPQRSGYADVAAAVEAQAGTHGWAAVTDAAYVPGRFDAGHWVDRLQTGGHQALVFLGTEAELEQFAHAAAARDWYPYLLLPGSLAGRALFRLPAGFGGRVFLAFPTLPADRTPAGLAELEDLRRRHGLGERHRVAQISAYTAAKVLVEGLKRAGRNLSREHLVSALEGLYNFQTGLTPPISYSAGRRIGALGAYVVAVDLEHKRFTPVGGWIALDY